MSSLEFKKHTSKDTADPGFEIPGRKLRWISARIAENSPGRPWMVIRKSELPVELVKHIEGRNPNAFAHGDTFRRGDLILAYGDVDAVKEYKREIQEKALDLQRSVKFAPDIKNPDGSPRAKVEINEERDVSSEMVARFKKGKE